MTNSDLFQKMKKLNFSEQLFPIIHLLERNLDKIEFVRDKGNLKNYLFLAEEKVEEEIENSYVFLEKEIDETSHEYDLLSSKSMTIYELEQMYLVLNNFFEASKEPLFIEIGFSESILTSEDKFEAWELLYLKECKDINEAETIVKKFPSWYNVRSSRDVLDEIFYMKKAEEVDEYLLYKLKDDLLDKINASLRENDKNLFYHTSELYMEICDEIKNKLQT